MHGKFIVVVGPSGSGKGTLIAHIKPLFPDIRYATSATTRAAREGEKHYASYFYLTVPEFTARIEHNDFLEWAEYGGNFYGTLKSEVLPHLDSGLSVLKEMEVQGARKILQALPRGSLALVFIRAGSWDEMEKRIQARAPMSAEELLKRKARYEDEMSFIAEADFIVDNPMGKVEEAKKQFEEVIRSIIEVAR